MGRSYGEREGAGTGPVGIVEGEGWEPGWPVQAWSEEAVRSLLERQPSQLRWERAELWAGDEAVASRVEATYQWLRALPRRVRRALQCRFALSLAELAILLALWQAPGLAATINVTGGCTLVNAIASANSNTSVGGCTAGSGDDTVVLSNDSTLSFSSSNNTTYGPNALPVVSSTITIVGNGSTIQRTGGTLRLLSVGTAGNLTLRDLTLTGGNPGTSTTFSDNNNYGGAIHNRGNLTLINSTIANSSTRYGGGIANLANGTLTLIHSTISGNTAFFTGGFGQGGGVDNAGSTAILTNSTVSSNSAGTAGGGLFNVNIGGTGRFTIANSTISGNTARQGGGVFNTQGTTTIRNSTISGNSATGLTGGGGLSNYNNGTLSVANSTISGNRATRYGGAVVSSGSTTLTNCTVTGNTAGSGTGAVECDDGSMTLVQTLVSGNTTTSGGPQVYRYTGCDAMNVNNYNIFGQSTTAGLTGFSKGATDIVPSGALGSFLNSTLAFNGGPTMTHNLVGGGEAVNRVSAATCAQDTDQRGFTRPSGATCDIGAVESGAVAPPVVNSRVSFVALDSTFSTTTDATGCPGGFAGRFSFQAQLTNLAGSPALLALKDQAVELTNGNLVQTADGGAAGVGSLQTLPQVGAFSDGELEATGTLAVPFVICLQTLESFRFTVDVLGEELGP